jgi:hypothetical protein
MRFLTTLILFCSFLLRPQAQCQYTLTLTDSASDGWGTGVLTVKINGTSTEYTLDDVNDNGGRKEIPLNVNTGDQLTLTYVEAFFNGEVGISLKDGEDMVLFSGIDPDGGQIYQQTVVCPSCVRPYGIFAENLFATSAKLRWNPVANAIKYRVIYGEKDFGPGLGDTIFSNTPKATISGLTEKTEYTYYVTTICDAQDTSLTAGPLYFETYWSDDLAVTGIQMDVSNCNLGASEPLSFQLTNFGANPQTLFNYYYSLNGIAGNVVPPADGLYTGVVGKDSAITIMFEAPANFIMPGEYEVCVNVVMNSSATDDNQLNNTFCKRINNSLRLPYVQGFEAWDGGWQATNSLPDEPTTWQHGIPDAPFISKAASGEKAWVTNLTGAHASNEFSYLTSPCYDFSSLTMNDVPAFFCNTIYDLEPNFDYARLEMSTNGGATWLTVGTQGTGLNWYNTLINGNPVWSGQSQGWQPTRTLLTGAQGQSEVMLRFVFNSDQDTNLEGFGVDNVQITVARTNDLAAVSASTSAELSDCGASSDSVRISVANFGTIPQSDFTIQYSINGGAPVSQTINQTIQPNTVSNFTFAVPFSSLGIITNIALEVILASDQENNNNTFNYTIDHRPQGLPFVEGFENGFPQNWTATNNAFITLDHGNISNVLAFNLWDDEKEFVYETNAFGLVTAGDSLTYQYRAVDFLTGDPFILGTNSLRVQISTDCGANFLTADLVNGTNHTPSNLLTKRAIDLTPYAGQAVKIRFVGQQTSGDFFLDIDNIGIRAKDVSTDDDLPVSTVRLYPNPTEGIITIEGVAPSGSELSIALYSLLGNLIYTVPTSVTGAFAQQMDMSAYPSGMYFMVLSDGIRSQTLKLIKTGE